MSVMPWLVLVAFLVFSWRRLLVYLHIFQQEEYDGRRFLPWLLRNGVIDRRLSAALIVIGLAALVSPLGEGAAGWVWPGLMVVAFFATAALEKNPRLEGKKKLAMTLRARRILYGAMGLAGLIGLGTALLPLLLGSGSGALPLWAWVLLWIVPVQLVPLTLVLGNLSLSPFEKRVQNRFWQEAHGKLTRLAPKVVAVTGSYGKTSVKHILGHILETRAQVLITPGSINTPMGITRIIRERLQPHHQFFVVEMGAYGPGSIARLCRLAAPDFGIITAIGKAHYERFKSLETVAKTKFELAEAAVARGGKVVVNLDAFETEAAKTLADQLSPHIIPCGQAVASGPEAPGLQIVSVTQSAEGVRTDVVWQGRSYSLLAPLYGAHHGANMALAFVAACMLGLEPEEVVLALKSTPQISHRLEVKRQANGSILIDDAYNSNPIGFATGLRLLDVLCPAAAEGGPRPGRRILVTPGMVELGEAHDREHEAIGHLAGQHVDILLPIRPDRIEALTRAYQAAHPDGLIVPCDSFDQASAWMGDNIGSGDVVLLENDLPDLYERRIRL